MTNVLPIELLLGIYLGILTGIIPALVAWSLGFLFKHFTNVSIPALAVVVLALAIAGINGGLLSLMDPTIRHAPNSIRLVTAIIVVLMISLYAHAQGDKMGAAFPRHLSLRKIRDRSLSTDVVELIGGRGQVRISIVGEIGDIEGYPPLSDELRVELHDIDWTFPADLPLLELESRFAEKLRTEFELSELTVRIDERGRASLSAAPPLSGLSKRIPPRKRAVSVRGLVPTGLARGDEVFLLVGEHRISGTVVSAQSSVQSQGSVGKPATDGGTDGTEPSERKRRTPTADGGDGRITVAVTRQEADRLLDADRAKIIVQARGKRREFELLSLLRQAGKRLRKVTVGPASPLGGQTIADTAVLDTYGVAILAVRRGDSWTLAPRGSTVIESGDELFVVGSREHLATFQEVTE